MDKKVIDITNKIRFSQASYWFKDKKRKLERWCKDNKEVVIATAPIIGSVALVVIRGAIKHHNLNKEAEVKEFYCYDRSLGHYWKLRRELRNDEWLEIDKRKQAGERLADILESLKVLD